METNRTRSFEFSDQLDIDFLNDLFEGDTEYATTVFGEFLKDMPQYWSEVEDAYKQQQIPQLKSAVHKCKTLFGYVGHTHVLELFQAFETKCETVKTTGELKEDFSTLEQRKGNAQQIIETEYQRLKQFHKSI